MRIAKKIGFFDAIISSISYGLYPLFAIPLYKSGSSICNALFYRYAIAFLIYWYILKVHKKINLSVSFTEFITLFFVGITFATSSIALFAALKHIDSGIACTIVFIYPVIVALIMTIFFNEKLTKSTVFSIICAFVGVVLLNYGSTKTNGQILGFIFALCGAICYALYMIFVKTIKKIKYMQSEKVTFYVMISGTIFYFICLRFGLDFQILTTPKQWICIMGLALLPTIISIETVNVAIRFIGATKTSIIGALEPLTAIIVGILVFSENFTIFNLFGFLLILSGIFIVVTKK